MKRVERLNEKAILARERFSTKTVIYSLIIFVCSLILFTIVNNEVLGALFGLIMILSGAIIVLFIIVYLIFFFLEGINKNSKTNKRKLEKKKKSKKRISKKITKKKK